MSEPAPDPNNQPNEDQVNAQKDMLLKQLLSSEARLRLNNVKMVKPDLANMVETVSYTHLTLPTICSV